MGRPYRTTEQCSAIVAEIYERLNRGESMSSVCSAMPIRYELVVEIVRLRGDKSEATKQKAEKLIAMRAQGETMEACRKALGVTSYVATAIAWVFGAPQPKLRGNSNSRETPPHVVERRKQVQKLRAAGITIAKIADQLGEHQSSIKHDLRRLAKQEQEGNQ